MTPPVLEIQDLHAQFRTESGVVRAVDGVSLEVNAGDTLALVGESGCGKSATAYSILGLLMQPAGKIVSGRILFNGENLADLDDGGMRRIRGKRIGMIFQEPMTSLNPVLTVGEQVIEAVLAHEAVGRQRARERAVEMLALVRIPDAAQCISAFPHHLSGGMRQRVMIAIALACRPDLLIADEPTTALDVTVQQQILELIGSLRSRFGMAVLLITHDMGVVAQYADRVAVMYAGRVVERGRVTDVFDDPAHPYTRGLLASIPNPGRSEAHGRRRLIALPGAIPDPFESIRGCKFRPRCQRAMPVCEQEPPGFVRTPRGSAVACFAVASEIDARGAP